MAVLSPFDPAQPIPLQDPNAPILPEVQAPVPEQAPPLPAMGPAPGAPPPVDPALQGPPGQQASAGPLPWPAPDWLHPEGFQPQDVPQVENPPPAPGQPAPGLNAEPMGPPQDLAGSPPVPQAPPRINPDPAMAQADQNEQEHVQALAAANLAEQQRNDFMSSAGVEAAGRAARDQASADRVFMQAQQEAKVKRQQLDTEAMAIANQKIAPNRAWHDASFGAKLAIGIATIVNGMVTKGNVGASPVVAMVNAICEQDMKAQEDNLANRTGALGVRRGLLAEDVAAGRDMLDFQYKSINAAYLMAENQIKAYALKYDNPVINAKAQEQLAQIHDARLKLGMDWHQQTVANDINKQQVAQGWKGLDIQQQNADTAKAAQAAKGSETSAARDSLNFKKEVDQRERIVPGGKMADGTQLYAKDKEVATKVNTKMAGANKGVAAINELTSIYKKHGWQPMGGWSMDDEARNDFQRANTLLQDVMTNFSLEKGQGTIRDAEYDRYEKMIGKPGAFIDPTEGSLAAMRDLFVNDVNDTLKYEVDSNAGYWNPTNHYKAPSFDKKGLPVAQPGAAGLPAQGVAPGHDPHVSPGTQEFIDSGKFTPSTDSKALIDYAGGG